MTAWAFYSSFPRFTPFLDVKRFIKSVHYFWGGSASNFGLEDFFKISSSGMNVMHMASLLGDIVLVKFLGEKGLDINVPDKDGYTPLHYLIRYGVGYGNPSSYRWTSSDSLLVHISNLIDNGADPNLKNSKGENSLDVLAYRRFASPFGRYNFSSSSFINYHQIVELLLDKNTQLNFITASALEHKDGNESSRLQRLVYENLINLSEETTYQCSKTEEMLEVKISETKAVNFIFMYDHFFSSLKKRLADKEICKVITVKEKFQERPELEDLWTTK